jgi:hypothetical protein
VKQVNKEVRRKRIERLGGSWANMSIITLPLERLSSSTDPLDFPARRILAEVNGRVAKAKKILVVSGAGISCSSGIPVRMPFFVDTLLTMVVLCK